MDLVFQLRNGVKTTLPFYLLLIFPPYAKYFDELKRRACNTLVAKGAPAEAN